MLEGDVHRDRHFEAVLQLGSVEVTSAVVEVDPPDRLAGGGRDVEAVLLVRAPPAHDEVMDIVRGACCVVPGNVVSIGS